MKVHVDDASVVAVAPRDDVTNASGTCLCGAVRYQVSGPMRQVIACHCVQCRKTSGHYVAATQVAVVDLEIEDSGAALRWYRSSDDAQRAFCGTCGSSLFWQRGDDERISIMAGTLDGATGLGTSHHIFTDDRGDYYGLSSDEPQYPQQKSEST